MNNKCIFKSYDFGKIGIKTSESTDSLNLVITVDNTVCEYLLLAPAAHSSIILLSTFTKFRVCPSDIGSQCNSITPENMHKICISFKIHASKINTY